MDKNCHEIHAILILFVIYVARYANCENISELSNEKTGESTNESLPIAGMKNVDYKKWMNNWMTIMGSMQSDLTNVQAMIVKDEDVKEVCEKADRKSNTRYLMCAGSILNRNHVLTTASCVHTATHIRHNIRGTLAVAIAPLKASMQVIRVTEYKVHPGHNTNPYSPNHVTHNLAILKLACRIEMENFQKIDLPEKPFVHTCSEENCIIAIFRKYSKTHWVMQQIFAPHVPLQNRRRKETMLRDGDSRNIMKYETNETTYHVNNRTKRKMAEPPIFMSHYETRTTIENGSEIFTNLTEISTTETSMIEETTTMMIDEMKNSSHITATSFDVLDGYEDWSRPSSGNETTRSFVVRSSDGRRGCAQTGAPVMLNRTQAAIVAVPCDDRQPIIKWGYTDIYENLDWIHDILQDWNTSPNGSSSIQPGGTGDGPKVEGTRPGSAGGNFSSCSTCIFNFFIEIGCKDKSSCGNKSISVSPHQKPRDPSTSITVTKSMDQGCLGANNTSGIDPVTGQRCNKKINDNIVKRTDYRANWDKTLSSGNFESVSTKNLPNSASSDVTKLEKSMISVESGKTSSIKDRQESDDKQDKYSRKDNSDDAIRISSLLPRAYKTTKNDDKNHDRASNEIGLENIEGDTTDWLSEVEKRLDTINTNVKRESIVA